MDKISSYRAPFYGFMVSAQLEQNCFIRCPHETFIKCYSLLQNHTCCGIVEVGLVWFQILHSVILLHLLFCYYYHIDETMMETRSNLTRSLIPIYPT